MSGNERDATECIPGWAEGEVIDRTARIAAHLMAGCASAGGTAGIFDIGSVWYKHPTTGDVKECGGGFYPGLQIRRQACHEIGVIT